MAEVPDGPPHRFRWRRTLHEVARAEGPGADRRRMVATPRRRDPDARLLPRRGPPRPPLLDLPPRPVFGDGDAALVRPRRVRVTRRGSPMTAVSPNWSRRPIISFLRGAIHAERHGRARRSRWACRHRHRRPQHRGRRGARARRAEGGARPALLGRDCRRSISAGGRRAAGVRRRHARHRRLSGDAPRLGPADPAADRRQSARARRAGASSGSAT